jgi:glycosyltransferase involved in cell wall biosynthesis
MHLMLVSETFPPEINGVALTVQNLLQELRAAGHRVTLVRPRQAGESSHTTDPDLLLTAGLPIPRYPGLRFGLPAARALRRRIRQQRPDAMYIATEGPLGWSALRIANALGLPMSSGFHTRFDEYFRHYGLPWMEHLALAWMRRFHNRARCTLVPTQALREFLLQRGFERVELLRRAVDTGVFDPRLRSDDLRHALGGAEAAPVVLFVGRIAAEKNLALCERAFAVVRELAPAARMVWVGDGPQRESLMQRLPEQQFTGVLRGAELARVYASSDLFLFASLSETFGNVTLEAMASGVAVCAFDYGAAHEHIADGESGYLAAFGDEEGFLQQVRRATQEWLTGRRLGVAARACVASLSPRHVADDLVQLMTQLQSTPGSATRSSTNTDYSEGPDAALYSTIL